MFRGETDPAIVAGENDRVLQFQPRNSWLDLADVVVHHAHHGSVLYVLRDGRIVDPRLALVQLPRGIVQQGCRTCVRRRDREVTENGLSLFSRITRPAPDRVMRKTRPIVRRCRPQFHRLPQEQVRRIKRGAPDRK